MGKLPVTYNSKEIPIWVKYWFSKKLSRKISEIITGQSSYVLENTLYKRFKKFEVGGNTEQNKIILPEEYQQVEYIESTGAQYIDTGINATQNTKIEVAGCRTQEVANSSWIGGNNIKLILPVVSNGTFAYFLNPLNLENVPVKSYNEKNIASLDKNYYNLNGTNYNVNYTGTITDDQTIKTSGFSNAISDIYPSYIRLWYLKVFENNTLIFNGIPCYRKSDNVIGMYDLVTNTFFTNAGTGTFLKGNVVTLPNLDFKIAIKNVVGTIVNNVSNKNLAPSLNLWENGYLNANGTITEMSYDNRQKTSPFIEIEENREYTYLFDYSSIGSIWIANCFYDKNKTMIGDRITETTAKQKTVISPVGAKYIRISSRYLYNDSTAIAQLEPGTTATPYVDHEEQTAEFTLLEGQFLATNEKLEDDGIHKKWRKKIFDGTETGWQSQTFANYIVFTIQFTDMKITNNGNGLSTHFYNYKRHNQIPGAICFGWSDNLIYFYVSTEITTIEEWKAYLTEQYANGTPVIVEYELEEEEIIPYTPTQQEQYNAIKNLKTYKDETIVEATSDELSPILTLQYWQKNEETRSNLTLIKEYKNNEEIPNKIEIVDNEKGTEIEETETKNVENEPEIKEKTFIDFVEEIGDIEESEVKDNETDS